MEPKLRELNASHLPYGEMRPALRRLLGGLEPIPVVRLPLRMPDWARLPAPPTPVLDTAPVIRWRPAPAPAPPGRLWYAVLIVVFALLVLFACLMVRGRSEPTVPAHKFDYNPDLYKIPPAVREVEKWKAPKAEPVAPDGAKE